MRHKYLMLIDLSLLHAANSYFRDKCLWEEAWSVNIVGMCVTLKSLSEIRKKP